MSATWGVYRHILSLGYACTVVALSLIPRRSGDRVKTNRRDAQSLARPLRAGELTAVWVPDETHEAVRDLWRTRAIAVEDYRRKRQHVTSFLLRHGRSYDGKTSWLRTLVCRIVMYLSDPPHLGAIAVDGEC